MELGLCLTLCALGGAFWIPALLLTFIAAKRRKNCTALAQGMVVDIKGRSTSDGLTFYPVYQYEAEGMVCQGKGAGRSPMPLKKGDRITVCYDPRRPQRSYIKGYDSRVYRTLSVCFGVMGAIPILICLGIALLN